MKEEYKDFKIFRELDGDDFEDIEKYLIYKFYKKDEVIIDREDAGKDLFIVASGKVISTLKLPGRIERKHNEFNPGDFFGEMTLSGNKVSFYSYIAAEDSNLIIMSEKNLLSLIDRNSKVAVKFTFQLLSLIIQRLRESSKFHADVVQWGEEASRRVITDELTGVYNRLFLEDALESFFNISKNNNKPLSLLMMDIDNFRDLNSMGQEAGNNILIEYAGIIKKIVSRHGIVARFGGDEFMVLLPEAGMEKALSIAEQICNAVAGNDFLKYCNGGNFDITTSIGVSSFPETAGDLASFKEKADMSLYRAKEMGRNRVEYVK